MAIYHWNNGNLKKAKEFYQEVIDNYFYQIKTTFPIFSEQQKADFYYNKLYPAFEIYNTLAIASGEQEMINKMYDHQLAIKGLVMYATDRVRENIINSNDSTLIKTYVQWINDKERLSQYYNMSLDELDEQNIDLDSVENSLNETEKYLSKKSDVFGQIFDQNIPTWKNVQAQLKKDQAAIELVRFRNYDPGGTGKFEDKITYAALILTQEMADGPELVLINNGKELENRYLSNYRNAIRFQIEEDFSYDQFWRPIKKGLPAGIKKVYFAPDGVYNQVSLNTFQNPETKKYLLEEVEINSLTNTKELLEQPTSSGKDGDAYLFGFPDYNLGFYNKPKSMSVPEKNLDRGLRGTLRSFIRGNELLVMLPGTKKEVEEIDSILTQTKQKSRVFLGEEALEHNVKSVASPKVLHIATHGFFLEDNQLPEDEGSTAYVRNPLLRSGLIMAGVNKFLSDEDFSGEDGILTAYEAMNLDLRNTDVVVLSACETGLGTVKNGEGVYGLQRAFKVAGAETIIMSLWEVDDAATQELMTEFYNQWLKGKEKNQAFRDAQLTLMKKYDYPFYWGAFVMNGE